jgi:hypothetical protein
MAQGRPGRLLSCCYSAFWLKGLFGTEFLVGSEKGRINLRERLTMTRNVFAVVFGVVTAVILIMIVETLGHSVYPPASTIDFKDMQAMEEYVDTLPIGALLFVMMAWETGTIGGGLVACFIARNRAMVYASIVGGMVLFGTVFTLTTIPHPLWFSITSVIGIAVATWITGIIGRNFEKPEAAE